MAARGVTGEFAAGGITGALVDMLHAGLFRRLWDVQAFDLAAVRSYASDAAHLPMSAERYASPERPDTIARQLDVMILGAAEVDCDFNVNVTCASDGRIIGGSGGHSDTAAGAKLAIVTTTLRAGGHAKLVDRLTCLTTPGAAIAAVVTEAGIAIHPSRSTLATAAKRAGLPLKSLQDLRQLAGPPSQPGRGQGRIIAECEAPTGDIIDTIRTA
jgi:citrate lyase subunit alpha/citrate CoA-transferase